MVSHRAPHSAQRDRRGGRWASSEEWELGQAASSSAEGPSGRLQAALLLLGLAMRKGL